MLGGIYIKIQDRLLTLYVMGGFGERKNYALPVVSSKKGTDDRECADTGHIDAITP